MIGLSSCNQNSNSQNEETDTLQVYTVVEPTNPVGFNLDQVTFTTQEIGEFPYLSAPSGYRHASDKQKTLEEKYFFYNDSLVRRGASSIRAVSLHRQASWSTKKILRMLRICTIQRPININSS